MNHQRIKKYAQNKYFIPIVVLVVNILFFIIFNRLFEIRYEELDDFTIMNIIAKSDGTYNYLSVHNHPILGYFLMLLYKTTLDVNWYSIFLLSMQMIAFTTIGTILIKKDRKLGSISYLLILNIIYSRVLMYLQYTSVATIVILAGILGLMYCEETKKTQKWKVFSLLLVAIGIMIRKQSLIIVLPFYTVWILYRLMKHKDGRPLKDFAIIMGITVVLITSNTMIYTRNPIYKNYTEFNSVRTSLFDYNPIPYDNYKKELDEIGWTDIDHVMLYSYSLNDENFYTQAKLQQIKDTAVMTKENYIAKFKDTFNILSWTTSHQFNIVFISMIVMLLFMLVHKRHRAIAILLVVMCLGENYGMMLMKTAFRTVISTYACALTIMAYFLVTSPEEAKEKNRKWLKRMLLLGCIVLLAVNGRAVYKEASSYHKNEYSYLRNVIGYTNRHKENAYIYSNALHNIYLAYSVYEKVPDNQFSNLRAMSDWDIYNQEYYEFKERYQLENIITDLYTKENVYLITGEVPCIDGVILENHIDYVVNYIAEQYHKFVFYDVVKEFAGGIKIYKLYELP